MNNKGVSSIIGAIFLIVIFGSLVSAYFVDTLSQNTVYNNAVRTENALDVVRMSENIQALDTAFKVNTNNHVTITVKIQNTGSSASSLVTLWVRSNEISGPWSSYNFTKTSITLQGGETVAESFDVEIQGLSNSGSYNFAAWFISSKGNSFSLKSGQSNTITFASVAAGIGSIAMDTKGFRSYVVTNGILGTSSASYSVSRSPILAFSVELTNFDITGKDLLLNSKSCFWVLNPPNSNGAVKGFTWNIAKVTGSTISPLPTGETIVLPYGQTVKIYFYAAAQINQVLSDGAASVNLLLVGSVATTPQTDYGQNLPFIAVTIVP